MLIIGEKLNSTIPEVQEAIRVKDKKYIQDLARKQVEAGAEMLDVNTAMVENEVDNMEWLVLTIQDVVNVPLCIDSTNPDAIRKALQVHQGKAMINSISLEKQRLDGILPLVLEYGCSVVALTMDEQGIPDTSEERIRIAEQLVEIAVKNNLTLDDVYIDPLVLPLAVNSRNAVTFFESLAEIKRRFKVQTISGLSNVSYSLPKRRLINRYFLAICMSLGLDAAILDPLDKKLMTAVVTTNLLLDRDPMCRKYLQAYRAGTLEE
jgi:5-methyltetrahydrofolate--homocysteine methyltransferase